MFSKLATEPSTCFMGKIQCQSEDTLPRSICLEGKFNIIQKPN